MHRSASVINIDVSSRVAEARSRFKRSLQTTGDSGDFPDRRRGLTVLMLVVCLLIPAVSASRTITTLVLPEGDGHSHRARYGTFDTWNNYPFQNSANPNN